MRDLLLAGALLSAVLAGYYSIMAARERFWGAVYFGIGVFLAWILLTGSSGWGPF